MTEYTPTTAEVREAWLTAEYEERDHTTSDDDLRAEFDRWLAAHDAEVRASVVPEEPEVEWGISWEPDEDPQDYGSEDFGDARALGEALAYDHQTPRIWKRIAGTIVPPGPWLPVEGSENDG